MLRRILLLSHLCGHNTRFYALFGLQIFLVDFRVKARKSAHTIKLWHFSLEHRGEAQDGGGATYQGRRRAQLRRAVSVDVEATFQWSRLSEGQQQQRRSNQPIRMRALRGGGASLHLSLVQQHENITLNCTDGVVSRTVKHFKHAALYMNFDELLSATDPILETVVATNDSNRSISQRPRPLSWGGCWAQEGPVSGGVRGLKPWQHLQPFCHEYSRNRQLPTCLLKPDILFFLLLLFLILAMTHIQM